MRCVPETLFQELSPDGKVTMTQKQYATLCEPKMYPHNKFGDSYLNNVGNMLLI